MTANTTAPAQRVDTLIGQTLADLGATHAFGVLGSGNFRMTVALRDAGATFVPACHESGALAMADGFAQVSGSVPVCSVHQGPGFTNALTALGEAAKARTPMVVLAADTPAAAVSSNFKIDQVAPVLALGAAVERVHGGATAARDAGRAWDRAARERRPVVLLVPIDLQEHVAETPQPSEPLRVTLPSPDLGAVAEIAAIMEAAERPIIVAGRGAVRASARAALDALAQQIGAPVITSAPAHGLFAGLEFSLGIAGGLSTELAARTFAESDLVLAFGASLGVWTTCHGDLVADAHVIQVDVDATALGRSCRIDLGIVADAREMATELLAALCARGPARTGRRTTELRQAIADASWLYDPFADATTSASVDPRAFTLALDAHLPQARTVVIDSGHFMGWPARYLQVPDAAGFVFSNAFESIGLGLPAAVGAAVARPDRVAVAALGDGGLQMSLSELETAARLGANLVIAVYNDAGYGAVVHTFGPQGDAVDLVQFRDTDYAAVARALGMAGLTVRTAEDLEHLGDALHTMPRPLLIDAKVNRDVRADWIDEAFR